jgi:hypothetical protein
MTRPGLRYHRAGADVALPSESSPLLVAGRLEARVRRAGAPQTRVVRVGSLTVDQAARTAQVDGRTVKLTRLEFDLLARLSSEPRRTFTRAELTRLVWDYEPQAAGPSRTVHSHVHGLRQKLEQAGAQRWRRPCAGSAGGSPDDRHPSGRAHAAGYDAGTDEPEPPSRTRSRDFRSANRNGTAQAEPPRSSRRR